MTQAALRGHRSISVKIAECVVPFPRSDAMEAEPGLNHRLLFHFTGRCKNKPGHHAKIGYRERKKNH